MRTRRISRPAVLLPERPERPAHGHARQRPRRCAAAPTAVMPASIAYAAGRVSVGDLAARVASLQPLDVIPRIWVPRGLVSA